MGKILLVEEPDLSWETVWGDGRLAKRYGHKVAEGIDINHVPSAKGFSKKCLIKNGEYQGKTLEWLYDNHKEYFGKPEEIRWQDLCPVGISPCWASDNLSIQVHPTDKWAKENGVAHGQAECWYFPEADEGCDVIYSHNAKTRDEFMDYINRNDYEGLVKRKPVKPGDFLAIKAGTLHAVQKGCYFVEVYHPISHTFRFYDYERVGTDGKPRQLNMKEALENVLIPDQPVIFQEQNFDYGDIHERLMADNPDYSAWLYTVDGKGVAPKKKPFVACFVIYGQGKVNGLDIKAGDNFLATRECDSIELEGKLTILACHG